MGDRAQGDQSELLSITSWSNCCISSSVDILRGRVNNFISLLEQCMWLRAERKMALLPSLPMQGVMKNLE